MKRLIISALIAAAAGVGSAAAADWNGPYIGIDGSYGWGKAKQPYGGHGAAFTLSEADATLNGWSAGALAGWNWSSPGWLVGLEAAGNWTNVKGDDGGSGGDINEVKGNAEANASGRLGFFWSPSTLMYGRFGYSWFNADINKLNGAQVHKTTTFRGPLYGVGLEFRLTPTAHARFEYRINDYKQRRVNMTPLGYDLGITTHVSTVSVGLSWNI